VLAHAGNAEVLRRPARAHDQVRIGDALAARGGEGVRRGVARHHARQAEIHGAQAAEDAARRVGDRRRLEAGRRHLVEEG